MESCGSEQAACSGRLVGDDFPVIFPSGGVFKAFKCPKEQCLGSSCWCCAEPVPTGMSWSSVQVTSDPQNPFPSLNYLFLGSDCYFWLFLWSCYVLYRVFIFLQTPSEPSPAFVFWFVNCKSQSILVFWWGDKWLVCAWELAFDEFK